MDSKLIYLVCKEGPEWCDAIEAHPTEEQATGRLDYLDSQLDPNSNFDGLSSHIVVPVLFYGEL